MGGQALSVAELSARIARLRVERAEVSARYVVETAERLAIARGVVVPAVRHSEAGVMLTVRRAHGIGYAATSDLSDAGLEAALTRAQQWADASERSGLFRAVELPGPDRLAQPSVRQFGADDTLSRSPGAARDRWLELLRAESAAMKCDARIVNWMAQLRLTQRRQWNFLDGELIAEQYASFAESSLEATAQDQGVVQSRSSGGQHNGVCRQLADEPSIVASLAGQGRRVAQDVLELLQAPNCPSQRLTLVLAPDQMMLQIHESIGHPLELDRILGDERNFAGTSFVTLDMFGTYAYGSPLLNVSFDPSVDGELASYAADDEGNRARRQMLIRNGILERPLGSPLSVSRAAAQGVALEGVANARASAWHRPAIDRMGNINVEPGDRSFESMIAGVERGVFMRTNASWSIDDSRNKFQFGCESGQMIENGRLTHVVRNPNYRGVSASFWRSLSAVGDASTRELHGTPFCGKGEPGQVIRVGHAAPVCVFDGVDVFGAQD